MLERFALIGCAGGVLGAQHGWYPHEGGLLSTASKSASVKRVVVPKIRSSTGRSRLARLRCRA